MPHRTSRDPFATATAIGLGAVSALHVLWGRGSTFPFRHRHELNDHVIGRRVSPSPAGNAVACLLACAAVSVERAARESSTVTRIAAAACGAVLASRAILGFSGHTHLVVPGTTSASFRRNDRRIFAPVCAFLATGATYAAVGPTARRRASPVS